jgi:acetylornithine/succinyldiaminopimelate/putrescine aminotransferase
MDGVVVERAQSEQVTPCRHDGKGTEVWDKAANRYLDFTGGIAVNALGHGRKVLARIAAYATWTTSCPTT